MIPVSLAPWTKSYDKPKQCIKKQRHHFANKGPYSQSYGFSGSRVCMWELDHKESWVPKTWCFWTVVLKKMLESPLVQGDQTSPSERKSILNIHRRTDVEAETPILWPPEAKRRLIRKDPDTGKIEGRRRRGWQRMRWLDGITNLMDISWASSRRWWRTGKPGILQSMGS